MAQINDPQLLAFIAQYLPDNDDQLIDPIDLRYVLAQLVAAKVNLEVLVQFAQLASPRFTGTPQVPTAPAGTDSDQVASTAFVQAALSVIASGKNLGELVLPQDVQASFWYLTSNGIWEARRNFRAEANPVNGPNWLLKASFGGAATTISVANIMDATDVGRAMLLAPSASAQRALVNNPQILAGSYGNHPSFNTEDGPAGTWAWVFKAIISLQNTPAVTVQRPSAPTNGQVDDQGDTFSFQPTTDYPSFAQYKVNGLPQTTGAEWLNSANSYVQNGRVYVRVAGAVAKGGLAVYVGASGSVSDGQVLTNDTAFTANNVVPSVPGALGIDFTINSATLSPGETLTFSAKATGGTAPYAHSVQVLNPDTGTVTALGTANTPNFLGTWVKVPAGVYLVTDAVTDAAGTTLVSLTRRVVVAVPGSGSGGALVVATRTRLGGVRIGEGLAITEEGVLSADTNFEALLAADNEWLGTNDFTKGLKLPSGGFVNEDGRLYIRQVDVGQRHFTFGQYYSLAKDSIIQWKPDEFIGQDGNGDVGLARSAAGVLEVNTGTKGSPATLTAMDVVFQAAPPSLNSGTKLAGALGLLTGLLTTAKTSLVVAINEVLSRLPKPGLGLAQTGNVIGLTKTVKNQLLGASVIGLIDDVDGKVINDNDFAKGYLASGFLPVEAGASIAFSTGIPQFSAYYDAAQVYLRRVNLYQDPYLNQVPPGAAFVRFSHPKAQYAAFTFTLGRLPYVRTVNNQFPDADGNVFVQASAGPAAPAGVATPSGTQLVFTQDAEYAPIYSGTFGVDPAGAKVGVVVRVELGPAATSPALPAAQFELVGANVFQAGRRQGFGFVVAASGKIEYFIYTKS